MPFKTYLGVAMFPFGFLTVCGGRGSKASELLGICSSSSTSDRCIGDKQPLK